MDIQRAKEILDSEEKITVHWSRMPVWIEAVDENSYTAQVHLVDNPQDKRIVSIRSLEEIS